MDKADKHEDDVVKIATRDLSLIHAAIPFLPVPVAAFCFFMNIVGPGTGMALCLHVEYITKQYRNGYFYNLDIAPYPTGILI